MARRPRTNLGGYAYHVMNRAAGRQPLFAKPADYAAFENALAQARSRHAMRICAYAIMPNHFHLLLWPHNDGDLSRFMQWLTMTHTQRHRAHRHTAGQGHLYQSRFKSFPIQKDEHFLTVARYIERNPRRADLADRAQDWPYASLGARQDPDKAAALLDPWPLPRPRNWTQTVNRPQTQAELDHLTLCLTRSRPFGHPTWTAQTATKLGLESTLRNPGRPQKQPPTD